MVFMEGMVFMLLPEDQVESMNLVVTCMRWIYIFLTISFFGGITTRALFMDVQMHLKFVIPA